MEMDIQQYVLERSQKMEKQTRAIQDHQVFDFNYIPEKPLMRQELQPIIDAILKYEQTGIPSNVAIFGSRGSGKTLLVKYLMNLFQKKSLTLKYVNVRGTNTSFKIIAEILEVQARGSSLSELYHKFKKAFPRKTLVILDEVDLMSPKDKNRDILYFLSRDKNNYMTILLSNNPRFLEQLDTSTKSTLQPQVIHFKNYNAQQIYEILKDRAQKGLKRRNDTVLKHIAALTTQNTNSDVRVALKTLFYFVTEPGTPVTESFENARKDIYLDLLTDLNDKNLILLKAVVESRDKLVKDVYQKYLRLSARVNDKAFSYVYFYNNLAYLQSIGLVLLSSAKVNRTYTNRITLTFDESALESLYNLRFQL